MENDLRFRIRYSHREPYITKLFPQQTLIHCFCGSLSRDVSKAAFHGTFQGHFQFKIQCIVRTILLWYNLQ